MKHTAIVVGYLGIKRIYIDVPMAEALARYAAAEKGVYDEELIIDEKIISRFEFNDEFGVYDAWPI